MPILYPASNRFKYARSASDFRARRYSIQNPFSPSLLFSAMEQGVWYDPSDLSTLYQDAAGTTPVTAVEQPVGRMLDKSGRGNHATQPTATSRPVLKQDANGKYYLFCDGIDDFMVTGKITPGTDKAQVFAGIRKLSDAASSVLAEFSTDAAQSNGGLAIFAPAGAGSSKFQFTSRGTIAVPAFTTSTSFNAPTTNVLTGLGDISGDRSTLRIDGTQTAQSTADQGTGNYGNYPLYLFRRGGTSFPFNGHFYGGIIRFGDNLPIETIEQTEAWMAAKTGVTL